MSELKLENEGEKIYCPYCSAPYTPEMVEIYNGSYGCDSGCEYYNIEVTCTSCGKVVYRKGDFGYLENEKEEEEVFIDNRDAIRAKMDVTPRP